MAAAGAPIRVSVAVACRVLGLTTAGYYKWVRDPVSQRDGTAPSLGEHAFVARSDLGPGSSALSTGCRIRRGVE